MKFQTPILNFERMDGQTLLHLDSCLVLTVLEKLARKA